MAAARLSVWYRTAPFSDFKGHKQGSTRNERHGHRSPASARCLAAWSSKPTPSGLCPQRLRAPFLKGRKLVLISILRAGNRLLGLEWSDRVGHVGTYRDPETLVALEYHFKVPEDHIRPPCIPWTTAMSARFSP